MTVKGKCGLLLTRYVKAQGHRQKTASGTYLHVFAGEVGIAVASLTPLTEVPSSLAHSYFSTMGTQTQESSQYLSQWGAKHGVG